MNLYQVTYTDGIAVEIEAWTPEAAEAIAEEEAEENGCLGLAVASIELLAAGQLELSRACRFAWPCLRGRSWP